MTFPLIRYTSPFKDDSLRFIGQDPRHATTVTNEQACEMAKELATARLLRKLLPSLDVEKTAEAFLQKIALGDVTCSGDDLKLVIAWLSDGG